MWICDGFYLDPWLDISLVLIRKYWVLWRWAVHNTTWNTVSTEQMVSVKGCDSKVLRFGCEFFKDLSKAEFLGYGTCKRWDLMSIQAGPQGASAGRWWKLKNVGPSEDIETCLQRKSVECILGFLVTRWSTLLWASPWIQKQCDHRSRVSVELFSRVFTHSVM